MDPYINKDKAYDHIAMIINNTYINTAYDEVNSTALISLRYLL